VRHCAGSAIARSALQDVAVDPQNRFLRVSGGFLVDFGGVSLVRYLGNDRDLTIGSHLETICAACFSGCRSLLSVRFAPGNRVSSLGKSLFARCISLQSICIPSQIESIPKNCFCGYFNLFEVTFESLDSIVRLMQMLRDRQDGKSWDFTIESNSRPL
jgi:hypothetical protein